MHNALGHLHGIHTSDVREPFVLTVIQALLLRFAKSQDFLFEHLQLLLACGVCRAVLRLLKICRNIVEANGDENVKAKQKYNNTYGVN